MAYPKNTLAFLAQGIRMKQECTLKYQDEFYFFRKVKTEKM